MEKLFDDGSTVKGMKLLDFLDWAHKSFQKNPVPACPDYGFLALPAIQRDCVWKPRQVIDLWDSVFRGFPIGALMLQERGPFGQGRCGGDGVCCSPLDCGWNMLDGQQRLFSLLLGRYGFENSGSTRERRCLWIDLTEEKNRGFKLYLTSASQPFGYKDDGTRLDAPDRRKARDRYECVDGDQVFWKIHTGSRVAYTSELFDLFVERPKDFVLRNGTDEEKKMPPEGHPEKWPPLPWRVKQLQVDVEKTENVEKAEKAYAVVPLHKLLEAWFSEQREAELSLLFGSKQFVARIAAKLEKILGRVDAAQIALIKVPGVDGENENRPEQGQRADGNCAADPEGEREDCYDQNDICLLFDRVGAGGTVLSSEDRLFALYKSVEPKFHDLILEIYTNVGRVMPPSRIAATAIRIANALAHQDKNPGRWDDGNRMPSVDEFMKEMKLDSSGINIKRSLLSLREKDGEAGSAKNEREGRFYKAFCEVFASLKYEKDNPDRNDNPDGFPLCVLGKLPPELIHVLVFWKIRTAKEFDKTDNHPVTFCLGWLLGTWSDDNPSRHCFEWIREKSDINLKEIFVKLFNDRNLTNMKIPNPTMMREILTETEKENYKWISIEDRISLWAVHNIKQEDIGRVSDLVWRWWQGDWRFLPWLQRSYLSEAFREYDLQEYIDNGMPYDIDHMIPQNDWGNLKRFKNKVGGIERDDIVDYYDKRRDVRWNLGNSIGNKWLVDLSLNRGWQDKAFPEKLVDVQGKAAEEDKAAKELLAGAFDPAAEASWKEASPGSESAEWTDARLCAFQKAVGTRAAWLYEKFYEKSGLGQWVSAQDDDNDRNEAP